MSHPGRPPSRLNHQATAHQASAPPNDNLTRPATRSSTIPLADIINNPDENVRDAQMGRSFLDKIHYTIPGEPMTAEHLSQALFYITQMKGITLVIRSAIRSAAYLVQDLSTSTATQTIINEITAKLENSLVAAISPQVAKILTAADSLIDTNSKLETTIEALPRNAGCVTDSTPQADPTSLDVQLHSLMTDTSSIKEAIDDLRLLAKAQPPPNPTPYRDALTTHLPLPSSPPSTHPASTLARAHAAIKERQILLDPDPDHPQLKSGTKKEDLAKLLQDALVAIETPDSPKLQLRSLVRLQNQGLVLEMNSREAADWIKSPPNRSNLLEKLGGKIRIKDRLYHIIVPFLPVSVDITDTLTLRHIEQENDLPDHAISHAKWVKDPTKRITHQRVAHAMFAMTSPAAANKLLKEGLYVQFDRLRPHKDKKEPLRCLKCQRYGHTSRECAHHEDACGTCAGNHRTTSCTFPQSRYCVNCKTDEHSSSDRKCPEFIKRCMAMDERTPENNMPYFPMEEEWTQVLLPPRPTTALTPTRLAPQQDATKPGPNRTLRQATLGEVMSNLSDNRDRAPRRIRGGRGGPPMNQMRRPPPPPGNSTTAALPAPHTPPLPSSLEPCNADYNTTDVTLQNPSHD